METKNTSNNSYKIPNTFGNPTIELPNRPEPVYPYGGEPRLHLEEDSEKEKKKYVPPPHINVLFPKKKGSNRKHH